MLVPALSMFATTMPESAIIEPTERSIPPVRMTKHMPILTTPLIDTCRRIFSALLAVKNRSVIHANAATIRISAKTMPYFDKIPASLLCCFAVVPFIVPSSSLLSNARGQLQDRFLAGLRPAERAADAAFMKYNDVIAHAEDLLHL